MGAPPEGWDKYLDWVHRTPAGRRCYVSNLHIEQKTPGEPPKPFDKPHPMQVEAQCAYETPTVLLTVDVKARQVGRSTQEGANQMATAHSSPGPYKVLIATNHQTTTDSSLRRFQVFKDNLARGLLRHAPVRLNSNKGMVIFERNNALIHHMTVGGSSEAKSWGYHAVVAEEMGKWTNAQTNWASIRATLPDDCPRHIISTPTGPGTLYAKIVQEVRKRWNLGDETVQLNFWPWFEHPEYRKAPPDDWEPDQDEADYAADIGLDPSSKEGRARLYWRHEKVWGADGIGLEEFRKEYPSNIDEGFLSWEGGWFDIELLNRWITLREAERNPSGEVRFYRRPEAGHLYVIGVDPSRCNGGDYATAVVMDQAGRVCAVMSKKYGGDILFARQVAALARMYHDAMVLVEANSIGLGVIRVLFNEGVNLWRDYSGKTPKDFSTGEKNREQVLSTARQMVNGGYADIPDLQILREMTFFREANGRLEGQDGEHDDHVFAFAFACHARQSLPRIETIRSHPRGRRRGVQQSRGHDNPHLLAQAATR